MESSVHRNPLPVDVSDEQRAIVAPDLTRIRADAPARTRDLREVNHGMRGIVRTGVPWRMWATSSRRGLHERVDTQSWGSVDSSSYSLLYTS